MGKVDTHNTTASTTEHKMSKLSPKPHAPRTLTWQHNQSPGEQLILAMKDTHFYSVIQWIPKCRQFKGLTRLNKYIFREVLSF